MEIKYRIIGLNKNKGGCYATVEYGKEDWFHSDFDDKIFPPDRQLALFDYFKKGDNAWKDNKQLTAVIKCTGLNEDGSPINPKIISIDNIN